MNEWTTEEAGFGLRRYVEVAWRRKLIVFAVILAAIGAAAAASVAVEPVYRAEMKLVVGQGGEVLLDPTQSASIPRFTATMGELVESRVVAERVITNLDLTETSKGLLGKISVSSNPDTAVLDVRVDDGDPERARQIAAEIGRVFPQLVEETFGNRTTTTPTTTTPTDQQQQQPVTPPVAPVVAVFDPAQASSTPISPRPVRNVVLAGVLGLVLGLLAAFLADYFDRTLRRREDVEQNFQAPVIGQVPFQRKPSKPAIDWTRFGEGAEAFRTLRANLQYLSVKRPIQTILLTSASAGQGKTTVSANLAIAIARSGSTAVVIEGDLRRPMLPAAFGVDGVGPGLTGVLVGTSDLDSAVIEVPLPVGASGPAGRGEGRVWFLPSGPLPPNPPELLSSERMADLLDEVRTSYDYVIIDSPPLLPVADGLELARIVDGVILVVRRNRTTSDEAREVRDLVDRLGISLLGVVFTDSTPPASYYYDVRQARADVRRAREAEEMRPVARGSGERAAPRQP
jgi:capsular exopolysaccharide synthesis family protein